MAAPLALAGVKASGKAGMAVGGKAKSRGRREGLEAKLIGCAEPIDAWRRFPGSYVHRRAAFSHHDSRDGFSRVIDRNFIDGRP